MKSLRNAIFLSLLFCGYTVSLTAIGAFCDQEKTQENKRQETTEQETTKKESRKQESQEKSIQKKETKQTEKTDRQAEQSQQPLPESGNDPRKESKQKQESTGEDDSQKPADESSSQSDNQSPRDNTPTPIDWSVEGTMELNFDHMKFNIQPDEDFQIKQLTADLIKLRGHRIRIRGYIRPSFRSKGITSFILVRDNQTCCFGPGAALYDCMMVQMAEGETTDFSTRPITVEGIFYLKPYRIENKVMAILQLKDATVE